MLNFKMSFIKVYYICYFIFNTFNIITADRKLQSVLNPGCDDKSICSGKKLIYTEAIDNGSIVHYLWDFNRKPTFLLAITPVDVNISVDWNKFKNYEVGSVTFTATPLYTFGVVLDKIFEFNDVNDTGIFSNETEIKRLDSEIFNWEINKLLDDVADNNIEYSVKGTLPDVNNTSGAVNISVYAFGNSGHGSMLPHLAHTENSSQIDIIFDQFERSFKNSRFAIQFLYFSTDSPESILDVSAKKTVDDEHTPGIFVVDTMTVRDSNLNKSTSSADVHGFLQWKPVVYTASERDVSNSTQIIYYQIDSVNDYYAALNLTLVAVLNNTLLPNLMVKAENVSFGYKYDGFYRKTNFLSWSFIVGIGTPPAESFSMIILLVLSIGLGLPIFMIVIGVSYIVYRRVAMHRESSFLIR